MHKIHEIAETPVTRSFTSTKRQHLQSRFFAKSGIGIDSVLTIRFTSLEDLMYRNMQRTARDWLRDRLRDSNNYIKIEILEQLDVDRSKIAIER